ncbi:hypothetical protein JRQ81_018531, partial [Phrynocephalus forsythii]
LSLSLSLSRRCLRRTERRCPGWKEAPVGPPSPLGRPGMSAARGFPVGRDLEGAGRTGSLKRPSLPKSQLARCYSVAVPHHTSCLDVRLTRQAGWSIEFPYGTL